MTNIAWKNLSQQRARFALSTGGVAFSVMLMLIVMGLYDGILAQATHYTRTVDADLWVSRAGTPDNLIQSMSVVPAELRGEIEAVPGVRTASPLLARALLFELAGRDVDLFLVGVDGPDAPGWPRGLRSRPGRGELIVDRVFATLHDLDTGDVLDLGGTSLRIVGTVRGGNALVYQYGWALLDDVEALFDARDVASHFLVRTDGSPVTEVARSLQHEIPTIRARTPAVLADAEAAHLGEGFRPMLLVLVFIALAVGTATIGLIIYTATVERAREYGVLKAIGFTNRRLYRIVLQQSVIAAGVGFVAGCGLGYAVAHLAEVLQPTFVATIGLQHVAIAAVATTGMALFASVVPARPIARLHPAEVFRA